jgi:hypothetical protein
MMVKLRFGPSSRARRRSRASASPSITTVPSSTAVEIVGEVVPPHLVQARHQLVEPVLAVQLGLAPQARVHRRRRGLVLEEVPLRGVENGPAAPVVVHDQPVEPAQAAVPDTGQIRRVVQRQRRGERAVGGVRGSRPGS